PAMWFDNSNHNAYTILLAPESVDSTFEYLVDFRVREERVNAISSHSLSACTSDQESCQQRERKHAVQNPSKALRHHSHLSEKNTCPHQHHLDACSRMKNTVGQR
ncbi:MAG TPA: hypothetical protein VF075_15290, partial [Pyrinomonadaceae bacterium]